MHEFREWPKTARLFRDIVVTEKLDGTNAAIHISALAGNPDSHAWPVPDAYNPEAYSLVVDGTRFVLSAQSRKRLIWPGKTSDNYGFAGWVYANAEQLVRVLGEGVHFGEWWGQGIQRGYGRSGRSFTLFNTDRYADLDAQVGEFAGYPVDLRAVPVLYRGPNDTDQVKAALHTLDKYGSVAAPGFGKPEGVCVYHSATRQVTKVTLDSNDAGKWEG